MFNYSNDLSFEQFSQRANTFSQTLKSSYAASGNCGLTKDQIESEANFIFANTKKFPPACTQKVLKIYLETLDELGLLHPSAFSEIKKSISAYFGMESDPVEDKFLPAFARTVKKLEEAYSRGISSKVSQAPVEPLDHFNALARSNHNLAHSVLVQFPNATAKDAIRFMNTILALKSTYPLVALHAYAEYANNYYAKHNQFLPKECWESFSLDELQKMNTLNHLYLPGRFSDASPEMIEQLFANLKNVTILHLETGNQRLAEKALLKFSFLEKADKLIMQRVRFHEDLQRLLGLQGDRIQALNLKYCTGLADLQFLSGFHRLNYLGMQSTDLADDSLSAISHLPLRELDLERCGELKNKAADDLANHFKALNRLNINKCWNLDGHEQVASARPTLPIRFNIDETVAVKNSVQESENRRSGFETYGADYY